MDGKGQGSRFTSPDYAHGISILCGGEEVARFGRWNEAARFGRWWSSQTCFTVCVVNLENNVRLLFKDGRSSLRSGKFDKVVHSVRVVA